MNTIEGAEEHAALRATIASLTAMLEKSVTLDVWKMTVMEFEKQIATLQAKLETAERALAKACGIVEGP